MNSIQQPTDLQRRCQRRPFAQLLRAIFAAAMLGLGSFKAAAADSLINVTPDMLSGSLTFFASPGGLNFASPIPYGIANNVSDSGWIWPQDNSGYLNVDFGADTPLSRVRAYVSYAGGGRGVIWTISYSDDGINYAPLYDFTFESSLGGGVNDDGTRRADYGGWYEAKFNVDAAQSHRYWQITQAAVTINHQPRVAQLAFYTQQILPTVKSTFPLGLLVHGGTPVEVQLQDEVTLVKTNSIALSINGISVTPAISKPDLSAITTVSYLAASELVNGTNTVRVVFGNDATPSVLQTNEFSFVAQLDPTFLTVTPAMLSGPLDFFASPAGLGFANPIPYGVLNNNFDAGWIWPQDNSGFLHIDLGTNAPLSRVRAYVTYGGGPRGAHWSIQFSDDAAAYTEILDYPFETRFGGGVGNDGSPRLDYGGWYEARFNQQGTESHRYWRIQQTSVSMGNQPRVGQMEFYAPLTLPNVIATAPSGVTSLSKPPISVQLEDGLSIVNASTIALFVNGTAVAPAINKPDGSLVTTVSFTPSQQLSNGTNTVRIVFGNDAVPSVLQTNQFTFVVNGDPSFLAVNPSMLSGPVNFFASPGGLTFGSPVPYGIANNLTDVGWIWPQDNSGYLNIDFGANTPLSRVRAFVSYAGAGRGVVWTFSYSDDGASYVPFYDYTFANTAGGGVNDDGTPRADFGGWYEAKFNLNGAESHRYWQIAQTAVVTVHQPRLAQMEFYIPSALPTVKSRSPLGLGVGATAPIAIQLEDALTAVNTNTIVLSVNGTIVAPEIAKEADSTLTTIAYAALGERLNGTNVVTLVFGNDATPSVLQTNQFSFVISLVSGKLRIQGEDSDGLLVLEAEDYDFQRAGTDATVPPNEIWTLVTTPAGFSGTGAMQALPNDPNLNMGALADSETVANSPRMDYKVKFTKAGTNYIWIRGLADSAPGASIDDSLHVGLDGQLLALSKTISGFPEGAGYVWSRGSVARFENVIAGPHVVNVWMRENGMICDKIVITSNPDYVPDGAGPTQTPFGVLQQESGADGLLVFEAETFDFQRAGTDATVPPNEIWTLVTTPSGFSGGGAMQALPNDPNLNMGSLPDSETVANSPRMDFNVTFVKPGVNYIWVRGFGDSAPGASIDDSLHLGLDGELLEFSKTISGFPQGGYVWSQGSTARFENVTAGAHVINIWMRENGMICDKVVITSNPAYVPTGLGPDETRVAPAPTTAPRIAIATQGGNIILTWTGGGTLQSADEVMGVFGDVGSSSPATITPSGTKKFYRIR